MAKKKCKEKEPQSVNTTVETDDSIISLGTGIGKTKPSMFSSLQSLTGHQFDELLMDALDIPKNITGLRKFCYANPITKFGMKIQLGRMLSISLIPIAILLIFTGYMFGHHLQASHKSNTVSQRLAFATELAGVMHFLQKERDMSSLYVSDIGPGTKDFLVGHYAETDKALESISVWPLVTTTQNNDWQTKDQFTSYLNRHRYELEILEPDSKAELIFYSEIIATFIILLYESTTQIIPGSVWKTLVALTEVVDSRESFGLERALGTLFYSRGGFNSREDYLWFLRSQDQGNHTLQVALEYSPRANELYEKLKQEQDETLSSVIWDMRYKIRSSSVEIKDFSQERSLNGSLQSAHMWFNNMTLYIDTLLDMQTQLSDIVLEMLDERYQEDRELLAAMAVIFSFVVVITPVILYSVFRLTKEIQEYSVHLADRTKKLNTEKRKTDTLLYQMLPKSVAEKLKHDEVVEPMLYSECTLFYTDIVGFTALCAMSSPVQVVDMLTLFFNVMDDIIMRYDIFKVETIGDAYMAASGLPRENGNKHASEICTMSLELIDSLAMLCIPHMPGKVFRIRTGCHSGPVIAGVIGMKMPRYCLFGETVTMVTLMESTGKPGCIQISKPTNDILKEHGGFITERRSDKQILASDTYWLINKKNMPRHTRKESGQGEEDPFKEYPGDNKQEDSSEAVDSDGHADSGACSEETDQQSKFSTSYV